MRYCYENPILTEQINNNIYLLTFIQANIDDFKQRLSAPLRSEVTVQKCQKRPFSTIKNRRYYVLLRICQNDVIEVNIASC
jgi:hypothetical protein